MKKEKILHPVTMFFGIWITVSILYLLKLSPLFLYNFDEVIYIVGCGILLPFFVAWLIIWMCKELNNNSRLHIIKFKNSININTIEKRVKYILYIWIIGTLIEIYFSGGVPIIWLYTGSEKTYMDFGLSSIHGLLNSLISAISIIYFWLFLKSGKKSYFIYSFLAITWAILAVTRQLIILNFIQLIVLFFLVRGVSWRMLFAGIISILTVIILFGVMGDTRSGSSAINSISYVENFPEWLPSGFLWVYVYMTSPINNLLYTADLFPGLPDLGLLNTISSLIPTIIRVRLFPDGIAFVPLVSDNLNMSSAYYGPYRDMGILGIIIYSFILSTLSCYYWYKDDSKSLLKYVVLSQCIIGSIFYNSLFFLPSIFQIFWINYAFKKVNKG